MEGFKLGTSNYAMPHADGPRLTKAHDSVSSTIPSGRWRLKWLRKNDGSLGVADRFERGFQCVDHRRGAAEKDHGVGTRRRQVPA